MASGEPGDIRVRFIKADMKLQIQVRMETQWALQEHQSQVPARGGMPLISLICGSVLVNPVFSVIVCFMQPCIDQ